MSWRSKPYSAVGLRFRRSLDRAELSPGENHGSTRDDDPLELVLECGAGAARSHRESEALGGKEPWVK